MKKYEVSERWGLKPEKDNRASSGNLLNSPSKVSTRAENIDIVQPHTLGDSSQLGDGVGAEVIETHVCETRQ